MIRSPPLPVAEPPTEVATVARDGRRPGRWDDDRRTPRPGGLVDGDRVRGGRVSGDARERALDRGEPIEGNGRIIARLLRQRVDTDHA